MGKIMINNDVDRFWLIWVYIGVPYFQTNACSHDRMNMRIVITIIINIVITICHIW